MQRFGRLLTPVLGSKSAPIACAIILIAVLQTGSPARAQSVAVRITFTDSIKEPADMTANATINKNAPTVVRSELTDAEMQETIDFSIALKMRNFAELKDRVGTGEIISLDEMKAKYFPTSAEVTIVRQWLVAQGFEVLPRSQFELSIFARGTVAQLERAFSVTFGRVQFAGEEHTSAVTAPSLPADIAGPVLSINGLQPHLHPFVHSRKKPIERGKSISNEAPYLVSEFEKAYNVRFGDGSGETIGIVIDTFPNNNDLLAFWATNSVPQLLNHIEKVQVVTGALAAPSGEETLDTEWSSGMAWGAMVRVYATTDLSFPHLDQAYQYIINDLPNHPALHQISMSFGLSEGYVAAGQMDTDARYFATIAGRGVTIFVSSGDGGSNPGTDGRYNPSNPIRVESPANDPNVTAVGGTSLNLDPSTGAVTSELTWFDGSGGGQSLHFPRPNWQPGTGTIPALGNGFVGRLVPDVALDADPNTGVFVVLHGSEWQFGGTSLSAPAWAGICARINQVRSSKANPTLGVLGPKVFPLLGSPSFRDITSGTNGAYNATSGFDLCTGIGVPDSTNLIGAIGGSEQHTVLGVAKDFNVDGQADLVWENQVGGEQGIWILKDGVPSYIISLPTMPPQWHIAGVGDFLGNGQADLVWENTVTGERFIWILTNGVYDHSILLPTEDPSWHIAAAADFDGDGQADLVWENSVTGERGIWLLKAGIFSGYIPLPTESTSWHIAGAADFNGDGKADLVWENSITGERGIWLLQGGVFSGYISLPTVPTGWHIVDH